MRKIGFGPFYLPLFCEYSRKQIEQGNQEIFFEHFAYETVKMYADYIHEIHLNLNFNDKLQLFELACFIHRKEMIKVTNSTKFRIFNQNLNSSSQIPFYLTSMP